MNSRNATIKFTVDHRWIRNNNFHMSAASEKQLNPAASYVNVSAYKFVNLDNLTQRRAELLELCNQHELRGTILLSHEGINAFVAGTRDNVDAVLDFLESQTEYSGLPVKESLSDEQPFTRMLVRIKKEIIAFGVDGIAPQQRTSPKLKPQQLKEWLDEGKEVTLLDVRNDYEVDLGTFDSALPIGVNNFREFPDAVADLDSDLKNKTIVMFCTGGIRCEKAGPFMQREGFENVYQLDGGILKYFEDCGGKHYDGECFVFDKRVAVDAELNETSTVQCYACQHPLTDDDQQSKHYVVGKKCPHCANREVEAMEIRLRRRNEQLAEAINPLPGSTPYDNHRPLNVPLKFDGQGVADFLAAYHPHVDADYWGSEITSGRILYKDQPVDSDLQVWAGQRLVHLLQGTVEPDVNGDIKVIYEDDEIIVVDKPAPIAMHPCGRFNRNSLSYILNAVYTGEKIRMTHRLDANTTGVVTFARKRQSAQAIQNQFVNGSVEKVYLAAVHGHPDGDTFDCDAAIAGAPGKGGIRIPDKDGLPALTDFQVLSRNADGTSLIECRPRTGRTNQIRIHLWSLGFPIVNDPTYLPDSKLGNNQTLPLGHPNMCLHALRLTFAHPTSGAPQTFSTDLPTWAAQ